MCFNKRLTLLTLKSQPGRGEPTETDRATVWADVSEPGTITKFQGSAAGYDIALSATMWRSEYKGYTHAEYQNTRYKIAATGAAANDLHIKLSLERG